MSKKKLNQFLLSNAFNASVVYKLGVLKCFNTQGLHIVWKSLYLVILTQKTMGEDLI